MKHLRPLLVLVLVLASTSSLVVPPPPASALCTCEPYLRTTFSSTSSSAYGDCSTLQANLYFYLSDIAADDCAAPVCFRRLVITQPCFVNVYGDYQMTGYMEYKCRSC